MKLNSIRLTGPVLFLLFVQSLAAQISIVQLPVNRFQCNSKDVWNLSIVSLSQQQLRVQLQAEIRYQGKPAVRLNSANVILNPGANNFNNLNLTTQSIDYLNKDLAEIELSSGFLPSGNYEFCVKALCVTQDCDGAGPGAVDPGQITCQQITVELASPLLLAYPEDNSKLIQTLPVFTWIPPMPVGRSNELVFDLQLSQRDKDQSRMDAINRNRPLIQASGLKNSSFSYPPDADPLQKGNTYVWRVKARVGNTYVSGSEIWEFSIPLDTITKKADTIRYCELKQQLDASTLQYGPDDLLFFIFRNPYANQDLNYKIYDQQRQVIYASVEKVADNKDTDLKLTDNIVSHGNNKYVLKLAQLALKKGVYTLEVYTLSNQTWMLRFEIL